MAITKLSIGLLGATYVTKTIANPPSFLEKKLDLSSINTIEELNDSYNILEEKMEEDLSKQDLIQVVNQYIKLNHIQEQKDIIMDEEEKQQTEEYRKWIELLDKIEQELIEQEIMIEKEDADEQWKKKFIENILLYQTKEIDSLFVVGISHLDPKEYTSIDYYIISDELEPSETQLGIRITERKGSIQRVESIEKEEAGGIVFCNVSNQNKRASSSKENQEFLRALSSVQETDFTYIIKQNKTDTIKIVEGMQLVKHNLKNRDRQAQKERG